MILCENQSIPEQLLWKKKRSTLGSTIVISVLPVGMIRRICNATSEEIITQKKTEITERNRTDIHKSGEILLRISEEIY